MDRLETTENQAVRSPNNQESSLVEVRGIQPSPRGRVYSVANVTPLTTRSNGSSESRDPVLRDSTLDQISRQQFYSSGSPASTPCWHNMSFRDFLEVSFLDASVWLRGWSSRPCLIGWFFSDAPHSQKRFSTHVPWFGDPHRPPHGGHRGTITGVLPDIPSTPPLGLSYN